MMGIIAQQAGNPELALKFIESALAVKPDFTHAWYNRALILSLLKRDKEALQSARAAAELDPGLGDAWDMIGQLLKTAGAYTEACECHKRAIALQPDNPRFYDNYASTLLAKGDLTAAYGAAHKAQTIDPAYPALSFCAVLKGMGYPALVVTYFDRIRANIPSSLVAETTATEAMARLQIGDMEQGWALWEQRVYFPSILDALPIWQGEKTTRLFLYEDQGMGDALQFMRYIPLLSNHADRLVLCLREPLRKLAKENFPEAEIIADDGEPVAPPPSSARYRLSSLPFFFSTRMENIPASPYLIGDASGRASWREVLGNITKPRIGLIWAGGIHYRRDTERSLNFAALRPLVAENAAHFLSLQKERAEDRDAEIFDAAPRLHDFSDTAALIMELDLVITVDTSVAHLAGALGKPVWILLPFDCDWRWFLGREDSPWYPSARLFRQKKPGDWASVIEKMAGELRKFIAGDHSVLRAPAWIGGSLHQNPDALPLPL